ncbi:MAG: M48 family metallopeptidase [Bacilli bacterium]
MKYKINNIEYDVEIVRKSNKNTYIRVKDDLIITVTTNYFVSKIQILKLLKENELFLKKALSKRKNNIEKEYLFYFLGKKYDIIIMPINDIDIIEDRIYISSKDNLNKWLKKQTETIFKERIDFWYNNFEENIPYPIMKIRDMKTRWGVCNRKNNSITINFQLIKYDIKYIDYVVIHELSHFIHFDHSKNFWNLVIKYCPNYKKIRKELKN